MEDEIVKMMIEADIPLTKENYLNLVRFGDAPDNDDEDGLPDIFRPANLDNIDMGSLVEKYAKGDIVRKVTKAVRGAPKAVSERRFPAAGTHEQAPGAGSGHLQDLLSAPYEERLAFQMDPRSSWLDEQGRDRLYMAAGLPTQPSNRMVGAYTPVGGTLEINPGEVARPMVRMDANGILPEDLEKMEAAELVRAITDAQNAGGYHAIIPDELAGLDERTSVTIPMTGNPTPEKMSRIAALADRNGMFATDTGSGINMINAPWTDIGAARTGEQLEEALSEQLGRDISDEMGGQRGWQHKIVAGQQSIQDELARPGQGLVTRRLLDKLDANQYLMRALEPEMRTKSYWNMMRDEERAATTGSIMRDDIQRARKIIAEGGYDGLRAALEAGVILPAAVMGVLLPILNQQDSQQDGIEVSN